MKTLTLHLEGLGPSDLPMKRLAEYLCELAELYGAGGHLHFASVTKGSARLNACVDDDHHHKVLHRVREVANGVGPKKAKKAYLRLADLMLDDQASGVLESEGCRIIQFPRISKHQPLVVFKHGSIQGRLYTIGGKDDSVPVRLEGANGETLYCETDTETAAQLAPLLFKQVRLHGKGEWERRQSGGWRLKKMQIVSYEQLEKSSLKAAIGRMKKAGGILWDQIESPNEKILDQRG
ncbi:hypothetical protein [Halomonas sp. MMSF_3323]|uniref:hypothetical protein n=1 Tax=Halomonas sp. MMSF_3323 TaxID=3046701 RepID=UPI00273D426B|nr:hypothetical protein [Halomonas sp. MMSF_3323]